MKNEGMWVQFMNVSNETGWIQETVWKKEGIGFDFWLTCGLKDSKILCLSVNSRWAGYFKNKMGSNKVGEMTDRKHILKYKYLIIGYWVPQAFTNKQCTVLPSSLILSLHIQLFNTEI